MSIVFVIQISEAISQLRKESYMHPKLRKRIVDAMYAGIEATSLIFEDTSGKDIVMIRNLEEFVGFLAAETGIALHGIYNQEDLDKVCDLIRGRLEERRATNISSTGSASSIVGVDGQKLIH